LEETTALFRTIAAGRSNDKKLIVGSVKSNVSTKLDDNISCTFHTDGLLTRSAILRLALALLLW
jgi:hypothetical protein